MSKEILEIHHTLEKEENIVVATIISSDGSTPRTSGTKMIVYENGYIFGTIGGGATEADVINLATELFNTGQSRVVKYDLNATGLKDTMDIICGGSMNVLLDYMPSLPATRELYKAASENLQSGQPFILVTTLGDEKNTDNVERHLIIDGITLKHKNSGISAQYEKGVLHVREPVFPDQTVYIFGAGHVSLELARFCKHLYMRIHVFDDREEFVNSSRFPDADGRHVCPGFESVFDTFNIGPDSYIVIVTRGHTFDKKVLAQALETDAGYIGMIGSRKKRDTIYGDLLNEGFGQSDINRVHSPIGLPIKAETPAEIGVSIVAELIQHRASSYSNE